MRFSLRSMLLIVTGVAVLCCSFLFANGWLANAYYTALWATILLAIVAAIQRQGVTRAYWIGFLVACGGYAWLALPTGVGMNSSSLRMSATVASIQLLDRGGLPQPELITTDVLVLLYQTYGVDQSDPRYRQFQQIQTLYQRRGAVTTYASGPPPSAMRYLDPGCAAFVTIGHSAIAVLYGIAVGYLSSRLYRSRAIAPSVPS